MSQMNYSKTSNLVSAFPTSAKFLASIPLSKILSFISYKNMNFLILDCPTDNTLPQYLKEFKRNHVTDVVRVCEPTYSTNLLDANGITVHDWQFKDGAVPPNPVIANWINLVERTFGPLAQIRKMSSTTTIGTGSGAAAEEPATETSTIAVHCVAGLGRAPVLVAIALIEAGMKPLQAVEHIRKYRRGAFNTLQLDYLDKYKRGQSMKKTNKFSNLLSKKTKSGETKETKKEKEGKLGNSLNVSSSGNGSGRRHSLEGLSLGNLGRKRSGSGNGQVSHRSSTNKLGLNDLSSHHHGQSSSSSSDRRNGGSGNIFSNINRIFKIRTAKSSPEVGVVN